MSPTNPAGTRELLLELERRLTEGEQALARLALAQRAFEALRDERAGVMVLAGVEHVLVPRQAIDELANALFGEGGGEVPARNPGPGPRTRTGLTGR